MRQAVRSLSTPPQTPLWYHRALPPAPPAIHPQRLGMHLSDASTLPHGLQVTQYGFYHHTRNDMQRCPLKEPPLRIILSTRPPTILRHLQSSTPPDASRKPHAESLSAHNPPTIHPRVHAPMRSANPCGVNTIRAPHPSTRTLARQMGKEEENTHPRFALALSLRAFAAAGAGRVECK